MSVRQSMTMMLKSSPLTNLIELSLITSIDKTHSTDKQEDLLPHKVMKPRIRSITVRKMLKALRMILYTSS
jgi:hypothetical protein